MEGCSMKRKWKEMPAADKFMLIVRIVASILVVAFAALQLLGVWDKAINLAAPLMGIVLLIQSVQEWKKQCGVAIFGLCAALFIFGCAIVVWFF